MLNKCILWLIFARCLAILSSSTVLVERFERVEKSSRFIEHGELLRFLRGRRPGRRGGGAARSARESLDALLFSPLAHPRLH